MRLLKHSRTDTGVHQVNALAMRVRLVKVEGGNGCRRVVLETSTRAHTQTCTFAHDTQSNKKY